MWTLGPLGFAAPWLLLALVALPILWLILRAVPPAPIRRRFPGVALLLGLEDRESQADRTPWWLMLIRTLAVAAVILGFAGPVLNPEAERGGTGPLLVLLDGTWADARDWEDRIGPGRRRCSTRRRGDGRAAAVATLTDARDRAARVPRGAGRVAARCPNLAPEPWLPDEAALDAWADAARRGRGVVRHRLALGRARPAGPRRGAGGAGGQGRGDGGAGAAAGRGAAARRCSTAPRSWWARSAPPRGPPPR